MQVTRAMHIDLRSKKCRLLYTLPLNWLKTSKSMVLYRKNSSEVKKKIQNRLINDFILR